MFSSSRVLSYLRHFRDSKVIYLRFKVLLAFIVEYLLVSSPDSTYKYHFRVRSCLLKKYAFFTNYKLFSNKNEIVDDQIVVFDISRLILCS